MVILGLCLLLAIFPCAPRAVRRKQSADVAEQDDPDGVSNVHKLGEVRQRWRNSTEKVIDI
jgi:hypothetical protein